MFPGLTVGQNLRLGAWPRRKDRALFTRNRDLVFDVFNPNDYRIRSTRLEVGVDLEGTHFGDALLDRPLDLSPTNHNRVVVPVRFEWAGVGAGAKALLTRRAVGYGITGRVLLDTPLGDKTVALTGKGNVPLLKLLK